MKKIIFCLMTICVALFAAACTPEDEAPVSSGGAEVSAPDASGTASEETLPPADESSSPWDKWNTDESLLTDAQRQQLEALREDGERHAGTFWYQEMMIFGRVDPAQPTWKRRKRSAQKTRILKPYWRSSIKFSLIPIT